MIAYRVKSRDQTPLGTVAMSYDIQVGDVVYIDSIEDADNYLDELYFWLDSNNRQVKYFSDQPLKYVFLSNIELALDCREFWEKL